MAAVALIKFTQGPNTAVAGVAVLGTLTDGVVTVTNGDNTDVASWTILLLDAPIQSSSYPVGTQPRVLASGSSNSPLATFTPDAYGSYRVLLDVLDSGGNRNRDIRCFGVKSPDGFLVPPFQKGPDPLPLALPGLVVPIADPSNKPDEQNYNSQTRGWAGDGFDGQLDFILRNIGSQAATQISTPVTNLTGDSTTLQLVDTATLAAASSINLPLTAAGKRFVVADIGASAATYPITINASPGSTFSDGSTALELNENSGTVAVTLAYKQVLAELVPVWIVERPMIGGAAYSPDVPQLTWYVDSVTGTPGGSGLTAETAIDTLTELSRRIEGKHVDGAMNIYLAGTFPNEALRVGCVLAKDSTISVEATAVEGATSVVTSFTPMSQPSTAALLVCNGIADFTPYLGRRIRFTTGIPAGACAWICKAPAANQAVISQPIFDDGTEASLAPTDSFVIETMETVVNNLDIDVIGAGQPSVIIKNLAIDDTNGTGSRFGGHASATGGSVQVIHSLFTSTAQSLFGDSVDLIGCANNRALTLKTQRSWLFGHCDIDGGVTTSGGTTTISAASWHQAGSGRNLAGFSVIEQGNLVIDAPLGFGNLAATMVGLAMENASSTVITASGYLWGVSSSADYGVDLDSDCWIDYENLPTLTGTIAHVRIGSVTKSWTQISTATGYVDATRNAGVVPASGSATTFVGKAVATYVEVGTSVATDGSVRFSNSWSIQQNNGSGTNRAVLVGTGEGWTLGDALQTGVGSVKASAVEIYAAGALAVKFNNLSSASWTSGQDGYVLRRAGGGTYALWGTMPPVGLEPGANNTLLATNNVGVVGWGATPTVTGITGSTYLATGSNPTTTGAIRGSSGFEVRARKADGTEVRLLDYGVSVVDRFSFGSDGIAIGYVRAGSSLSMLVNGSAILSMSGSYPIVETTRLFWRTNGVAQALDSAGAGYSMTLQGGTSIAAGQPGGAALVIGGTPGAGGLAGGVAVAPKDGVAFGLQVVESSAGVYGVVLGNTTAAAGTGDLRTSSAFTWKQRNGNPGDADRVVLSTSGEGWTLGDANQTGVGTIRAAFVDIYGAGTKVFGTSSSGLSVFTPIIFANYYTTPTITQGAYGDATPTNPLTIQAQPGWGSGTVVGGNLALKGGVGSGGAAHGKVQLWAGSMHMLDFAQAVSTYAGIYPGAGATSGIAFYFASKAFYVQSGSMQFITPVITTGNGSASFLFDISEDTTTATIQVHGRQTDAQAGSIVFRAGNALGTSTNFMDGGHLTLQSGAKSSNGGVVGKLKLYAGPTQVAEFGLATTDFAALGLAPADTGTIRLAKNFTVKSRNEGGTDNVSIITDYAEYGIIAFGDTSRYVNINSGGGVYLQGTYTNIRTSVGAEAFRFDTATGAITVTNNTFSPTITQLAHNDTPHTFTIQAQNVTAGATGSSIDIKSGTGTSIAGNVSLYCGTTAIYFGTPASTTLRTATTSILYFDNSNVVFYKPLRIYSLATGSITYEPYGGGPGIVIPSDFSIIGQDSLTLSIDAYAKGGDIVLKGGKTQAGYAPSRIRFINGATSGSFVEFLQFYTDRMEFTSTVVAPFITQATHATTPHDLTIQAQSVTSGTGSNLILKPGVGTTANGTVEINPDEDTMIEAVELASRRIVAFALGADLSITQMPDNTGDRVIFVANAAAAPSANSSGGFIHYGLSGVPYWRTSAGATLTLDGMTLGGANQVFWSNGTANSWTGTPRVTRMNVNTTDDPDISVHIVSPDGTAGTRGLRVYGGSKVALDVFGHGRVDFGGSTTQAGQWSAYHSDGVGTVLANMLLDTYIQSNGVGSKLYLHALTTGGEVRIGVGNPGVENVIVKAAGVMLNPRVGIRSDYDANASLLVKGETIAAGKYGLVVRNLANYAGLYVEDTGTVFFGGAAAADAAFYAYYSTNAIIGQNKAASALWILNDFGHTVVRTTEASSGVYLDATGGTAPFVNVRLGASELVGASFARDGAGNTVYWSCPTAELHIDVLGTGKALVLGAGTVGGQVMLYARNATQLTAHETGVNVALALAVRTPVEAAVSLLSHAPGNTASDYSLVARNNAGLTGLAVDGLNRVFFGGSASEGSVFMASFATPNSLIEQIRAATHWYLINNNGHAILRSNATNGTAGLEAIGATGSAVFMAVGPSYTQVFNGNLSYTQVRAPFTGGRTFLDADTAVHMRVGAGSVVDILVAATDYLTSYRSTTWHWDNLAGSPALRIYRIKSDNISCDINCHKRRGTGANPADVALYDQVMRLNAYGWGGGAGGTDSIMGSMYFYSDDTTPAANDIRTAFIHEMNIGGGVGVKNVYTIYEAASNWIMDLTTGAMQNQLKTYTAYVTAKMSVGVAIDSTISLKTASGDSTASTYSFGAYNSNGWYGMLIDGTGAVFFGGSASTNTAWAAYRASTTGYITTTLDYGIVSAANGSLYLQANTAVKVSLDATEKMFIAGGANDHLTLGANALKIFENYESSLSIGYQLRATANGVTHQLTEGASGTNGQIGRLSNAGSYAATDGTAAAVVGVVVPTTDDAVFFCTARITATDTSGVPYTRDAVLMFTSVRCNGGTLTFESGTLQRVPAGPVYTYTFFISGSGIYVTAATANNIRTQVWLEVVGTKMALA